MRTIILAGSLLSLLSCFSCTAPRPMKTSASTAASIPVPAPPPPAAPTPQFLTDPRIVSIEHRFKDPAECARRAKDYYNESTNPKNELTPPTDPTNPLIYSFPEPTLPLGPNPPTKGSREVRFIVVEDDSVSAPIINYYLVDKKTGNSSVAHRRDLLKVYKDLAVKGSRKLRFPRPDSKPTNGKTPWRAVMNTAVEIPPPDATLAAGADARMDMIPAGEFGIIINPPYP